MENQIIEYEWTRHLFGVDSKIDIQRSNRFFESMNVRNHIFCVSVLGGALLVSLPLHIFQLRRLSIAMERETELMAEIVKLEEMNRELEAEKKLTEIKLFEVGEHLRRLSGASIDNW